MRWQEFGWAIRNIRLFRDLTIDQARVIAGVSHARWVNAEQGKPIGTEIFLRICRWSGHEPMAWLV